MIRVVILALALTGCAAKDPGIRTEIVRVTVDRPVACVGQADVPVKPATLGKRPANVSQALDLAVAKVLEFTSYADRADALLTACARVPAR